MNARYSQGDSLLNRMPSSEIAGRRLLDCDTVPAPEVAAKLPTGSVEVSTGPADATPSHALSPASFPAVGLEAQLPTSDVDTFSTLLPETVEPIAETETLPVGSLGELRDMLENFGDSGDSVDEQRILHARIGRIFITGQRFVDEAAKNAQTQAAGIIAAARARPSESCRRPTPVRAE